MIRWRRRRDIPIVHLRVPAERITPENWEQVKMRYLAEAVNHHAESTSSCIECGLPIRLHPPGRQFASDPAYCEHARQAVTNP